MRGSGPTSTMTRRSFVAGLGALVAGGCTTRDAVDAAVRKGAPAAGRVELYAWFDLPRDDPRSRELSGLAWDAHANVLWAVQDESPSVVALVPDRAFKTWRFGDQVTLDCGGPVDLEGLVLLPDGFVVASEAGPRVVEVDRRGKLRRELTLPARFQTARKNKSLESLTASPSGRYLFTTSETALGCDGEPATTAAGARVRIVRFDRENPSDVSEHVYVTDPVPYERGDWGIADLAATSDDEVLVLERGWAKKRGNTVRIYRTILDDERTSCGGIAELSGATPALPKHLCCDLALLQAEGLPASKQPQASPLLDNYEGIAVGPRLPDGRGTILMVSDDNNHNDQFARILVLAHG